MKKINKKKFIEDFKKDFEGVYNIQTRYMNNNNTMLIIDSEKYFESVIEFIPATKNTLYTIYINCNGNDFLNNWLVDYFKNIPLEKNYVVADRLNNIDYMC